MASNLVKEKTTSVFKPLKKKVLLCGKKCPVGGTLTQRQQSVLSMNLTHVIKTVEIIETHVPGMTVYYAMKVNSDPGIIQTLNSLGHVIHCNTMYEIEQALTLGVPPEKIFYAMPFKPIEHCQYACARGVGFVVVSCVEEVEKIAEFWPGANVVVRCSTTSPDDNYSLERFTCMPHETDQLAKRSADLGVNIIGVMFHLGASFNHQGAASFKTTFPIAQEMMQKLESYGFKMRLLNVGGGFPTDPNSLEFRESLVVIREFQKSLTNKFPKVKLACEPGNLLAEKAGDLYVKVMSKRAVKDENGKLKEVHYALTDGQLGNLHFMFRVLMDIDRASFSMRTGPWVSSRVFGNCSPAFDCLATDIILPDLKVGDWLCFKEVGGYRCQLKSRFFSVPPVLRVYIAEDQDRARLSDILQREVYSLPPTIQGKL